MYCLSVFLLRSREKGYLLSSSVHSPNLHMNTSSQILFHAASVVLIGPVIRPCVQSIIYPEREDCEQESPPATAVSVAGEGPPILPASQIQCWTVKRCCHSLPFRPFLPFFAFRCALLLQQLFSLCCLSCESERRMGQEVDDRRQEVYILRSYFPERRKTGCPRQWETEESYTLCHAQ